MRFETSSETTRLASHLRDLRVRHGLTLASLADRSGVSRASLSRIENAEVSPTAETLGRLATVYALPISHLLGPLEQGFQPVMRRADQAVWQDPTHGFERRSVSPPNGTLSIELIEGTLKAGQRIAYDAPAIPGQEHHVYVLSGEMAITVEGTPHHLRSGDCLRYVLFGETVFETSHAPCKYVIALS
ncbi:helix-turn-helix domain-containing protein [Dinoroseobacter sp. S124A]|uniref:helix-turn-helix domain-containing protein n=1 Tax=Dinoroseobacter sp. S124A TaxID=3415128 RepID=UPI003C79B1E5